MSAINWNHRDEWHASGKHFLVTVRRHSEGLSNLFYSGGPHRWCVYAYIYPKHPHFANFKGSDMWQEAATAMQLHSGPTFLRWHYDDDGKALSVQVGADYNHLYDDHFTHYATQQEAAAVFNDAAELHEWLTKLGATS